MNKFLKISIEKLHLKSIGGSIGIHVIIFFSAAILMQYTLKDLTNSSPYVEMFTIQKEKVDFTEEGKQELNENKIEDRIESVKPDITKGTSVYYDFSNLEVDTTNLQQIYKENTLDVSIKYPSGWSYIDQNIDNKLDGVTFWSVKGNYNPPPYIHIEVKEKYLFNENRFEHSMEMDNYVAYYNNPEELAGQVSQTIYLRTEIDEDFSIKLIMKGAHEFRSFQPVFFSMLKTFKFKSYLF